MGVKNTLTQQLALCVRALRHEASMSQVVFGKKCSFYQTYLSRIKNGQANLTLNAMEVKANALGLTVFDLFERLK